METSPPLSPDDVLAAAEVHNELGPQYRDAVLESFLAKIDDEIGARVDARLAATLTGKRARKNDIDPVRAPRQGGWQGGLAVGVLIGLIAAGVPLGLLAAQANAYSGRGQWQVWLIWALIAAVYSAGVAGVLLWNKRRQ